MSKIICDICGTSYADTATQCPICGCVRPAQPQPVPEDDAPNSGYTYVKGGRFSKSNVKKRIAVDKKPNGDKNGEKKGTGIILIAIILVGIVALGAILWACGIFDIFAPGEGTPSTTPAATEPTQPLEVSCEGLSVTNKQYTLQLVGDSALIDCRKLPSNATDVITFVSENEEIATVDDKGKVTAVQNGTTNIIITCGNVTEKCEIVVGDGVLPVELVLKETEIVLKALGETKSIYDGSIPVDQITWTTSNEFIASVSNGVVTAIASGPATITATYMGKSATCEVLCDIEPSGSSGGITEDGGNTGIGEDGGNAGVGEDGGNTGTTDGYELYTTFGKLSGPADITMKEGESISLYLRDGSGNRINLEWTCTENDYVSVENGVIKAVKALSNDFITVKAEHEGKVYTCKIRVRS